MPKSHNKTGRSNREARHVRLYKWILDSPAYLSLTPQARAVLVEIARLYDGTNNGWLGLSVRTAAERCNIAKNTAARALDELQERGFIECVKRGAFSLKSRHATEWRLTWWNCNVTGQLPTKPFMRWGREKTEHGLKIYRDSLKSGPVKQQNPLLNARGGPILRPSEPFE